MAQYITVSVVCPCGKLYTTKNSNAESKSITRGAFTCSACKRKVEYAISGTNVYSNYK